MVEVKLLLMKTTVAVKKIGGMRKKEGRYHSLRYQGTFNEDNGGGAKGRRGVGKGEAVPLSTSLAVLPHTLPTGAATKNFQNNLAV